MAKPINDSTSDSDFVWGAEAIGAFIGRGERATFHMLTKKQLPATLVGGRWVASRERLRVFLTQGLADA